MPDALELPRMLRAVIKLMRRERLAGFGGDVVDEFVAFRLGRAVGRGARPPVGLAGWYPGFAAVVGALNDLPEPAAGLRRKEAVGRGGRALDVVNLPTCKVRAPDLAL